MSVKQKFARKAVKSTAKHTAHGTASKLKRDPLRATTLLALGCAAGVIAGWLLSRKCKPCGERSEPAPPGAGEASQSIAPGQPTVPEPPTLG